MAYAVGLVSFVIRQKQPSNLQLCHPSLSVTYVPKCLTRLQVIATLTMFEPAFTITTSRLTISHFDASIPAHCQLIHDLYNAPATQASNAAKPIPDLAAAKALVEKGARSVKETGYGRYLVTLSSSPSTPIGMVGMALNRFPDSPHQSPTIPDLGFGLLPQFHGMGYAAEATAALVKYYREERGVSAFAGFTSEGNEGATRVFERLGWKCEGVRDVWGVKEGEVYKCVVWTDGLGEDGREVRLVDAGIGGPLV